MKFITILYNSINNTYTYDTICDNIDTAVKRINNFRDIHSIVIYKIDAVIERYDIQFYKYIFIQTITGSAVTLYNTPKPMNVVLKNWDDEDFEHQLIFCN